MQRQRDVMNYMILEPEQLDNDEAIDAFEKAPAYNRKKKSVSASVSRPAPDNTRRAEQPQPKSQEKASGTIEIEFDDDL